MSSTSHNRGGPGRGQGRKPVKQGEETVTLSLRVTVAQREKLARLGGAEWVRGKIDRAKEPNAKVSGSPGFIGESDSTAGLERGSSEKRT
jgi:hypothetical protein